jgi:hypothetical protein
MLDLQGMVKYNLEINCFVNKKSFHTDRWVKAKIRALELYPNSVPTFTVQLFDGSIFNYIPVTNIIFNLNELCYHNCPKEQASIHRYDFNFKYAYIKQRNQWVGCSYLLTVDWFTGNDVLHMIKLDNGQFAFLPNHKLNVKNKYLNINYRKIRETYSV